MRWCVQGSESDEALVKRAQGGDREATEKLLRRHMNLVLARARQFFLAGGDTDDLVQEGMIGLYSAINEYDGREGKSFKNFAYLCVTRQILDAVKRSSRLKNSPLNNSVSLFDRVMTMYLEGMSYLDICEATGKDIKSVDNALARAKRKLIGYLK